MALEWMDNFTSYGTDASRVSRMLNGPYAETTRTDLVADPDPTAGGQYCLQKYGGGLGGDCRKVLSASQTTVGFAARYWLNFLPTAAGIGECPSFMAFKDVNNVLHIQVRPNPSGYIEVYRNDSTGLTLIGTTTSPVIVTNAWRHLEAKVVFDAAAGSVQIKLEGQTCINVSGIRTTSNVTGAVATCAQVAFQSEQDSSGPVMYVKDFILWNGTGSVNNDFFGTCQVYKIVPDGDITLGTWSPSTGTTGYNLINETTPDDDAGYIAATATGTLAEFSLTDLPVNTTVVKAVMTVHRSKKADGGDGQIQVSLFDGTTNESGADRTITTAYTYWWDTFDQAPGAVNWSKSIVNGLHIKINRTV